MTGHSPPETVSGLQLIFRKGWRRMRATPLQGLQKGWRLLTGRGGVGGALDAFGNAIRISRQYAGWLRRHVPTPADLERMSAQVAQFKRLPTISVLMPVYNTEERWLRRAIDSVRAQIYPDWELCIADDASSAAHVRRVLAEYASLDARIKVAVREVRGHISAASNDALGLATGEFVALLDHDDEIAPNALFEVARLLNQQPDADFIYSDEDKIEMDGRRTEPFFKPAWSPLLLTNANYVTHFAVLRRALVEQVGGFRDAFVGSQDYDLFLRVTEQTHRVCHIPKVLYSWRKATTSAALGSYVKDYALNAASRALSEAIERRGLEAEVERGSYPPFLRIRYRIVGSPRVSIIAPVPRSRGQDIPGHLQRLRHLTDYPHVETLLLAEREQAAQLAGELNGPDVRAIGVPSEASPGERLSAGAAQATGDVLLFMAWGTMPLDGRWLSAMLEYAQLPTSGCVGAKLLSRRGRILHAGMALGVGGTAAPAGRGLADVPQVIFYLNLKDATREVSAVSAACLMVRRELFEQVGGFDARFRHRLHDVDLCLRVAQRGTPNVYTPYARLRAPANAISSGDEGDRRDALLFQQKWEDLSLRDPFYNPNLSSSRDDMSITVAA